MENNQVEKLRNLLKGFTLELEGMITNEIPSVMPEAAVMILDKDGHADSVDFFINGERVRGCTKVVYSVEGNKPSEVEVTLKAPHVQIDSNGAVRYVKKLGPYDPYSEGVTDDNVSEACKILYGYLTQQYEDTPDGMVLVGNIENVDRELKSLRSVLNSIERAKRDMGKENEYNENRPCAFSKAAMRQIVDEYKANNDEPEDEDQETPEPN